MGSMGDAQPSRRIYQRHDGDVVPRARQLAFNENLPTTYMLAVTWDNDDFTDQLETERRREFRDLDWTVTWQLLDSNTSGQAQTRLDDGAGIKGFLEDMENATPNDPVVVYYGGHALVDFVGGRPIDKWHSQTMHDVCRNHIVKADPEKLIERLSNIPNDILIILHSSYHPLVHEAFWARPFRNALNNQSRQRNVLFLIIPEVYTHDSDVQKPRCAEHSCPQHRLLGADKDLCRPSTSRVFDSLFTKVLREGTVRVTDWVQELALSWPIGASFAPFMRQVSGRPQDMILYRGWTRARNGGQTGNGGQTE